MRKIKIFGLPSHQTKDRTSGVDFARIIQPLKHLNGYKDEEVEFETTMFDIHGPEINWMDVAREYDIIFLNYINNPWAYAAMGAMARKYGVKLVLDTDDALWNLKDDNPAQEAYKKGGDPIRNFSLICNDVDFMTTTNSYLKHVIMNNTKKKAEDIKVFPNYIDLDLYNHKPEFRDTLQIQLMHFGSTTHFQDLSDTEFAKGIDKIFTEYPNVNIKMIGAFLPKYKLKWGPRYEVAYGHVDIYEWIKGKYREYMDDVDIIVVPLTVDIYNKAKSGIKYLEASAAGKPGVYQNIRQYSEIITDGENGFLAADAQDWYKAIKKLIDDAGLRKRVGQKAYDNVFINHTIQDNIWRYAEFFKSIIDLPPKE